MMEQKQKGCKELVLASAVASIFALSGCGGGGGGDSSPAVTTPPAPSLSGLFTDDPVTGLSYTTSGGYSSTTDAQGHFKYNSGETVTFKVGNLTLGTAKGGSTLSPIDLAADDTTKATNLYVLLQSLNDQSSALMITIPAVLANADLSGIDLSQATATFASTGNAALIAAQSRAGITTGIVTAEAALTNATSQFRKQAAGVWQAFQEGEARPIVFRFDASGGYLMGDEVQTPGTVPGIESGTITVDPLTGRYAAGAVTLDTNMEAGLSNRSDGGLSQTMKLDGPNITVRDASGNEVWQFRRVSNDASSLVGAWALNSATSLSVQHFVFLADGHYMMLDPLGDTESSHCGGPGMEYGTYTFSSSTGALQVTGVEVDTNGCAGLSESGSSGTTRLGTLAADGSTFTLGDGNVLRRVSP